MLIKSGGYTGEESIKSKPFAAAVWVKFGKIPIPQEVAGGLPCSI